MVLRSRGSTNRFPTRPNGAYFITDGEPQGCWDWIRTILECAGLRAPDRRISLQGAARIGAALEVVYGLLRISAEPPMTRFVAAQLGVDHYFKIDSARESYKSANLLVGKSTSWQMLSSKKDGSRTFGGAFFPLPPYFPESIRAQIKLLTQSVK